MSKEEQSSVEKLRRRLYARAEDSAINADVRTPLSHDDTETPVAWTPMAQSTPPLSTPMRPTGEELPSKKISFAGKFLLGSGLFFVWAAAIAGYIFFGGGNLISPQNIGVEIIAPSLIDGGEEATFQVLIANNNTSALELVDLLVSYPQGTRDPKDPGKALLYERQSLGTIARGEQVKRSLSGIFFGAEGTEQKVKITLQYSITGSNAVFEKEEEVAFMVGSSPVSLSIDAPTQVIAGEQFTVDIRVQSNATEPVEDVVVQGQYPFGFSIVKATPSAATGGIWRLGTLEPGSSQSIRVTGVIEGQSGDERVFRFLVGTSEDATDAQVRVPFLTVPVSLSVERPFISGAISLDGKTGKTVAVSAGKTVQGTISWQNNLADAVADVQLTLKLDGPVLDKGSVTAANGFYQSSDSTIVWTKDQDPSLANVPPGGTASMQFSFTTLEPGSGGTLYSNPTINLNLQIRGTRQSEAGVPQQVSSAATMQATLASAITLEAQSMHFSGPFDNEGPMPPKVEQETAYTIQWTVKNSSNTVANATVATVLPPYVDYVRGESGVSYDSSSRTVTWALGDLKAGVGYSLSARTAAFQVTLTPSVSQAGQSPALSGTATFNGQDRFASVAVTATAGAPTINLAGESGYDSDMGRVSN